MILDTVSSETTGLALILESQDISVRKVEIAVFSFQAQHFCARDEILWIIALVLFHCGVGKFLGIEG